MEQFEGVLPIDKPAGWTSHDVVAKLRGMLRMKRIGHAGTLDPDVTGVLPLALGKAARLIEYMQEMPKEYVAEMTIGYATDTEDSSGQIIERAEQVNLQPQQVKRVMESFIGEIEQVPPMYSAVKVNGQRLYELARQGRQVERAPRTVTIHSIHIEDMQLETDYPTIRMRVLCSKGTYIRTLCKDIGEALGFPAVMSGLTRTMSCGIPLSRCVTIEQIAAQLEAGQLDQYLLAADEVLVDIPALHVEHPIAVRLLQGQKIRMEQALKPISSGMSSGLVRIYAPQNEFIGIGQLQHGLVVPRKMFQSNR